jgi:hypothetical protein
MHTPPYIQGEYIMSDSVPQNTNTTITVTDLQNMLVLIDLATQRGALRAAELTSVGALYEKITMFLKESAPNTTTTKE